MAEWRALQFLGGAGTGTGSRYLISLNGCRILLDCGLFQGPKELRLRNWQGLPVEARELDAVVLSDAHTDHSGYLPVLVRAGFHGPVFCTPGTEALLRLFLPDAARLQAEDAAFANRHGYSKHRPPLPLYTTREAEAVLRLLHAQPYGKPFAIAHDVTVVFQRAAHILGSATVELRLGDCDSVCLVFSGALGRWNQPILRDPDPVAMADVLVVELTCGDGVRASDTSEALARIVCDADARGGAVIVPTFAIGQAQDIIWRLRQLEEAHRIPALPVFIDSPMATDMADIYLRHLDDHNLHLSQLTDDRHCALRCMQHHLISSIGESKRLNGMYGPMIVLAPNEMATGGRVLHHLKLRLPDERTTVLLPGSQAAGTRGRALGDGAREVRIHGQTISVRAKVVTVDGLSAHADRSDVLRWLGGFRHIPRTVYVAHGEPAAAAALAETIRMRRGWHATVAHDGETVGLEQ